jgi:hypothetical protein
VRVAVVTLCVALVVAAFVAVLVIELGMRGTHPAAVQPATARQVAAQLGASGFTDCGPAPAAGVTDAGVAYLGGRKIAIDTFPGPGIRDQWLSAVRSFGIVPFRQGAQWVAYASTSPGMRGCA